MRSRRVLVLVLLSAYVCACSKVPTPAVPESKLTADDLEVFAAVVNDTIRKSRNDYRELLKRLGRTVNEANARSPILVADNTLQTCEVFDHVAFEKCADSRLVKCLSAYPIALQEQTRKSYRISDAFAPDILIVDSDYYRELLRPPDLGTMRDRLRARYPQIQADAAAVVLTAPLYPHPREAVVLMRHYFNGAACLLLRLSEDGWTVERGLGGWIE